jgi:hypothetical protein
MSAYQYTGCVLCCQHLSHNAMPSFVPDARRNNRPQTKAFAKDLKLLEKTFAAAWCVLCMTCKGSSACRAHHSHMSCIFLAAHEAALSLQRANHADTLITSLRCVQVQAGHA